MKKEISNVVVAVVVLSVGIPLVAYFLRLDLAPLMSVLNAVVSTATFVAMVLLAAACLKYITSK